MTPTTPLASESTLLAMNVIADDGTEELLNFGEVDGCVDRTGCTHGDRMIAFLAKIKRGNSFSGKMRGSLRVLTLTVEMGLFYSHLPILGLSQSQEPHGDQYLQTYACR